MTFRPRLGDVLLGAFALVLVLAVMHRAETYSHAQAEGAKAHLVHPGGSKASRWPRPVA